jgi:hypothetical protein
MLQPPVVRALLLLGFLSGAAPARAQGQPAPSPSSEEGEQEPAAAPRPQFTTNYELGFQTTFIGQQLFKFHSLYRGPKSLPSHTEFDETDTYTVYLGVRPLRSLDIYVNPEMSRGEGIGFTTGLAGFTNGEAVRVSTLSKEPYLARYFGRWTVPAGRGDLEAVEAGENRIAGSQPSHRIVLTAGKLSTADLFDTNSYANSARTQFMNWALINDPAYDYAADTRGYSRGIIVEWLHPKWGLRAGAMQMPKVANGPDLAPDVIRNQGDQVELELHPRVLRGRASLAILRLLGYANLARMGNYRAALALAAATGTTPDITAVRHEGALKYGAGLNFEQPLADTGATGLFARLGWNDGQTESFCFTECDRAASLGIQVAGNRWHRPRDRFGPGLVANGISDAHRAYLAAGGIGFQLGDGRLNYGLEQILESYYTYQFAKVMGVSLDFQHIRNPGYNQDRGPVNVLSFRTHLEF